MTADENDAQRKKMIFDSMSPRRQKHIVKKGYDNWDPFSEPKDPIDMRMDKTKRTSQSLMGDFIQAIGNIGEHGDDYKKGAYEICLGIINQDERYLGMFDYACWYKEELKKHEK